MTTDETQKDTTTEATDTTSEATPVSTAPDADKATPATPAASAPARTPYVGQNAQAGSNPREFKKNRRTSSRRRERPRSEFEQKILDIRRVTRVSSGGRRFSFAVAIAIGDKKGRLGVGTGKAGDTSMAIEKAVKNAKKNLITVRSTATNSIPHSITYKYSSARIMLMPANGRGIVAGSAVRDCLELAGLSDVNGKIVSGSKNKLNIACATRDALQSLKTPKGKDTKAPKKEFSNSKPLVKKEK